jgi:hypothetical protein
VKRYNGKLVGILGTVIIHLLAAITFMSFQLHSLKTKQKKTERFEIEFTALEEKKIQPKPPEQRATSVEKVLRNDAEMLNIARNLANQSEEKVNPKDYIDKVKEELIQSGKLGTDNYLDSKPGNNQPTEDEQIELVRKDKEEKEEKSSTSQTMAANYRGPTRIYYDLQGRNHTYLPIPIYKCQGSGKIVLIIDVDQKGNVENARVLQEESTVNDECLIETATGSALASRFESDENAPRIQKGTLTYIFVAQ